ncbi:PepSY domain-containing protein [Alkalihalobacillus trypoxylicola]|uniref:PepSY domain-containing protein n=1 Tax=Alkalihalobacillus trypoxylicola TaxID=519424 RepID=A0A162CU85_9BACI|nr:PepSY domain-containing protein [Alkalihalobacillus trypoxylicola]KYG26666.1 hypothetical protein AZF04_12740 [Alkalihalobacillus trypoxylicola]
MSIKRFIAGFGLGIVVGYALKESLNYTNVSPEKALKNVKREASKHHQITGSWIHMKPEILNQNQLSYQVYIGGLTTKTEKGIEQFDFVVDSKTGTIIEMSKANE